MAVTLGGSAATAGLGATLGPALVGLVFGRELELAAGPTAAVAAGTVFAIGSLVLTVLLLARSRPVALLRGWAAGLVPAAAFFALAPVAVLPRTATTFLVLEAVAWCWFAGEDLRAGGAEPRPDRA
ncbi:MAG: hypothetical protein R2731_05475 [Nocardioides sp.]